jgi:hypothetical protein
MFPSFIRLCEIQIRSIVLRSSLFWDVTQRRLVVSYWRFEKTYRSIFNGQRSAFSWTAWSLNMGPIGCPETSATNYQSALHNSPEERSHSHRGWSLKLPTEVCYCRPIGKTHVLPSTSDRSDFSRGTNKTSGRSWPRYIHSNRGNKVEEVSNHIHVKFS